MRNKQINVSQLRRAIESEENQTAIDPTELDNMLESVLLGASNNSAEEDSEQLKAICGKMLNMLWNDLCSDGSEEQRTG
jgi:hypothetical protein